MRMRIGLHYGPVKSDSDALSGETAKIAHWVGSHAKPEQSLATKATIDRLPRMYRAVSRYVDDETWNFISLEHVELYEIIWDVEAITAAAVDNVETVDGRYEQVRFNATKHGILSRLVVLAHENRVQFEQDCAWFEANVKAKVKAV